MPGWSASRRQRTEGQGMHREREVRGEEAQDEGNIQESLRRAAGRQEG